MATGGGTEVLAAIGATAAGTALIQAADAAAQRTALGVPSGGSGQLSLCWKSVTEAVTTLTNQPNTEQFFGANNRSILQADLSSFTQVRLVVRVITASASANSPRVYMRYKTTFSTTTTDYATMGASEVNVSMSATGMIDTGWINLVAGAKADVFLALLTHGGDSTADPALGPMNAFFK